MRDLHDCGQCKFTDGSEVSIRVCSECFDKTSWEPKTSDVQTRINLNPCPLPRIGSKDWGWTRGKVDKYSTTIYTNKFGRYFISEFNSIEIYKENNNYPIAESLEELSTAKRIAELLARRDWRRENRGKK